MNTARNPFGKLLENTPVSQVIFHWVSVSFAKDLDAPLLSYSRMQGQRRIAGGKLAPSGRLEFERQPQGVAVELYRGVHIRHELDDIGQLHNGTSYQWPASTMSADEKIAFSQSGQYLGGHRRWLAGMRRVAIVPTANVRNRGASSGR